MRRRPECANEAPTNGKHRWTAPHSHRDDGSCFVEVPTMPTFHPSMIAKRGNR